MKKHLSLAAAIALCAALAGSEASALNLGGLVNAAKDAKDVVQAFNMNDKKEVELGKSVNPLLIAEMGGEYNNAALQNYVDQIGQKLAKNSERNTIPYTFTVVNTSDVNAFAIPGGFIYVTKGLLQTVRDEAELAAVLGHEVGHVVKKHGVDQMQKVVLAEKGAKYATSAAGSAGGAVGAAVSKELTNIFAKLALSGYGRAKESEADRVGITLANKTNYDPNGAVRLFEHFLELEKKSGGSKGGLSKFFASHPDTKKRLADAKSQIGQLDKKGKLTNEAQFKKAVARLQ